MINHYTSLSYKTRNILILVIFLFIILIVGAYFVLYSYPQKIKLCDAQIKKTTQEISQYDGIEGQYLMIQELIEKEEEKLSNLDKQIVVHVTPAMTYTYLNAIQKYSGTLEFDMVFSETKYTKQYGYNIYKLKGEGSFSRIYDFTWLLERGPQIYKIKKLNLLGVEGPKSSNSGFIITYELELWALFSEVKDFPEIKKQISDVKITEVKNPFNPQVSRSLPPNVGNLLVVERAKLKAVIPGKAFVADHRGQVHVLQESDKVYLGYVTRIDAVKNQVEFTLNKSGVVEKFVLTLRFD